MVNANESHVFVNISRYFRFSTAGKIPSSSFNPQFPFAKSCKFPQTNIHIHRTPAQTPIRSGNYYSIGSKLLEAESLPRKIAPARHSSRVLATCPTYRRERSQRDILSLRLCSISRNSSQPSACGGSGYSRVVIVTLVTSALGANADD